MERPDNSHYARTLYVAARTGALVFTQGAETLGAADLRVLDDRGAHDLPWLPTTLWRRA